MRGKSNIKFRVTVLTLFTFTALTLVAQELKAPKISGLVNGRYSYSDKEGDTHGFDIRRVRLAADGMLSDKRALQFSNARSPMFVNVDGNVTAWRALHPLKASPRISVTPSGIKICKRLVHSMNVW